MTESNPSGGKALLVVGDMGGDPSSIGEAVSALVSGALVLMSCEEPWEVERLLPRARPESASSRLNLKRYLLALSGEQGMSGSLARIVCLSGWATEDGLRFATAEEQSAFPEDRGLEWSWIRDMLASRASGPLIVLLDVEGLNERAATWAEELGESGPALVLKSTTTSDSLHLPTQFFGLFRRRPAADSTLGFGTLIDAFDGQDGLEWASRGPRDTEVSRCAPWLIDIPGLPLSPPPTIQAGVEEEGALLPGRILLEQVIGEGSFGRVYRGRQLTMDREVAVKLLRPDVTDPDERRRFAREIRMLAHLNHPNIVSIYQADLTASGQIFFAMELLEGGTLADRMRPKKNPLTEAEALAIAVPILQGLSAAHQQGIVHSDLKPENVGFRTSSDDSVPQPVLVDFGVSRLLDVSKVTAIGGTPRYMAPEQLAGAAPTFRSDVYAFGLVLLEMLSGSFQRPDGEGASIETLERSRHRIEWGRFFERALADRPEDRFPDASACLSALPGMVAASESIRAMVPAPNAGIHLVGREADLERLVGQALFEPVTVVTGPSGVGKTALVAGGLLPRLAQLNVGASMVVASPDGHLDIDIDAVPGTRIVVVDQAERVVEGSEKNLRRMLATLASLPSRVRTVVVLEEGSLGRWMTFSAPLRLSAAILRLDPLRREDGAALLRTLLGDEGPSGDVVNAVLDELALVDVGDGVLPLHLHILADVIRDASDSVAARLILQEGWGEVLKTHLSRVLDRSFPEPLRPAARGVLVELFDARGRRLPRPRVELCSDADRSAAFNALVRSGILTRSEAPDHWELAHDRLVEALRGWCEESELASRGARELLRFHVHRSDPDRWQYLGTDALREVRRHPEAIAELEDRWQRGLMGPTGDVPSPARLYQRSRQRVLARRIASFGGLAVMACALTLGGMAWSRERALWEANIGVSRFSLRSFNLDERGRKLPVEAASLADLELRVRRPGETLHLQVGPLHEGFEVTRQGADGFEARGPGGVWTLEVLHRHVSGESPCPPSYIRGVRFHGHEDARPTPRALEVPSCRASRAGTILIPAGPFHSGDQVGEDEHFAPRVYVLPDYRIDRDEMSSELVRVRHDATLELWAETPARLRAQPVTGNPLFGRDGYPATNLSWTQARDVCEWFGKSLPSHAEVEKAARGGVCLSRLAVDGSCPNPNPIPQRSHFWGDEPREAASKAGRVWWRPKSRQGLGPAPRGADGYASPYGVRHLAGNAFEWLADDADSSRAPDFASAPLESEGAPDKLIYGGWWHSTYAESLRAGYADRLSSGNQRSYLGFRCVLRAIEED